MKRLIVLLLMIIVSAGIVFALPAETPPDGKPYPESVYTSMANDPSFWKDNPNLDWSKVDVTKIPEGAYSNKDFPWTDVEKWTQSSSLANFDLSKMPADEMNKLSADKIQLIINKEPSLINNLVEKNSGITFDCSSLKDSQTSSFTLKYEGESIVATNGKTSVNFDSWKDKTDSIETTENGFRIGSTQVASEETSSVSPSLTEAGDVDGFIFSDASGKNPKRMIFQDPTEPSYSEAESVSLSADGTWNIGFLHAEEMRNTVMFKGEQPDLTLAGNVALLDGISITSADNLDIASYTVKDNKLTIGYKIGSEQSSVSVDGAALLKGSRVEANLLGTQGAEVLSFYTDVVQQTESGEGFIELNGNRVYSGSTEMQVNTDRAGNLIYAEGETIAAGTSLRKMEGQDIIFNTDSHEVSLYREDASKLFVSSTDSGDADFYDTEIGQQFSVDGGFSVDYYLSDDGQTDYVYCTSPNGAVIESSEGFVSGEGNEQLTSRVEGTSVIMYFSGGETNQLNSYQPVDAIKVSISGAGVNVDANEITTMDPIAFGGRSEFDTSVNDDKTTYITTVPSKEAEDIDYARQRIAAMYPEEGFVPDQIGSVHLTDSGYRIIKSQDGSKISVYDEKGGAWYVYEDGQWDSHYQNTNIYGKPSISAMDALTAATISDAIDGTKASMPDIDIKRGDYKDIAVNVVPPSTLHFDVGPASDIDIAAEDGSTFSVTDGNVKNPYSEVHPSTNQTELELKGKKDERVFNLMRSETLSAAKGESITLTIKDKGSETGLTTLVFSDLGEKTEEVVVTQHVAYDTEGNRVVFDSRKGEITVTTPTGEVSTYKNKDVLKAVKESTSDVPMSSGITATVRDSSGVPAREITTAKPSEEDKPTVTVTEPGKDPAKDGDKGTGTAPGQDADKNEARLKAIQNLINAEYKKGDSNINSLWMDKDTKFTVDGVPYTFNDLVKERNRLKKELGYEVAPAVTNTAPVDKDKTKSGTGSGSDKSEIEDDLKKEKTQVEANQKQLETLKQQKAINDINLAAGPDLMTEEQRAKIEQDNKKLESQIKSIESSIKQGQERIKSLEEESKKTTTNQQVITTPKGDKYDVHSDDLAVSVTPQAGGNTYYNTGSGWYYIHEGKAIYIQAVPNMADLGGLTPGKGSTMSQETLDVLNKAYTGWDANKKAVQTSGTTTTIQGSTTTTLSPAAQNRINELKTQINSLRKGVEEGKVDPALLKAREDELAALTGTATVGAGAGDATQMSGSPRGNTDISGAVGKAYEAMRQNGITCTTNPSTPGCASSSADFEQDFKSHNDDAYSIQGFSPYLVKDVIPSSQTNGQYSVRYYDHSFVDGLDRIQVEMADGRKFVRQVDSPGIWYSLNSDRTLSKYITPAGSNDAVVFADADKKAATVTGR